MTNQRVVPVELLEEASKHLKLHAEEYGHPGQPATIAKLRAIIDGPGVEPVATKLETSQFAFFHVSGEDALKLKALPVGTGLYLAAPQPQIEDNCDVLMHRINRSAHFKDKEK